MKKANIFVFILSLSFSFMANAISLEHLDSDVEFKREQLTEVQFDNYLLNLKGTKVNWRRKVLNVEKLGYTVNNKFRYIVRLKNNDYFASFNFFIPDEQLALTLNKNQEYDFSGEVLSAGTTELSVPIYFYIGISGYD